MSITDDRASHGPDGGRSARVPLRLRVLRLIASRPFQRWAAHFPLTRAVTRREGDAMMDLVAGFVHSQCLAALIEFDILNRLMERAQTAEALARAIGVPPERMEILLRAAGALGLLHRAADHYTPTRRGAALTGVPGLADMIRHHAVLYKDLADPAAFFRGDTSPALARFWPYVFGAGAADDPETTARYSTLMAESQGLVADDTLATGALEDAGHLLDIGGGTGAFLKAALTADSKLTATLFDLPAVVAPATERFAQAGLADRATILAGSFRDDALPTGADTITLIRVLYDHADDTVADLLAAAFAALPPGGRIVVSEPMADSRAGDAYFAVYTLAMETGRTRSQAQVAEALHAAGFTSIRTPKSRRPFVTSVVTATKPDTKTV